MRSEHRTTGDEFDMRNRRFYCYLGRAGAVKWIKTRSHRIDRRAAKQATMRAQHEVD